MTQLQTYPRSEERKWEHHIHPKSTPISSFLPWKPKYCHRSAASRFPEHCQIFTGVILCIDRGSSIDLLPLLLDCSDQSVLGIFPYEFWEWFEFSNPCLLHISTSSDSWHPLFLLKKTFLGSWMMLMDTAMCFWIGIENATCMILYVTILSLMHFIVLILSKFSTHAKTCKQLIITSSQYILTQGISSFQLTQSKRSLRSPIHHNTSTPYPLLITW